MCWYHILEDFGRLWGGVWIRSISRQITSSSDATVYIGETFIIHAQLRKTTDIPREERKQIQPPAPVPPTLWFSLCMSINWHPRERGKPPEKWNGCGKRLPRADPFESPISQHSEKEKINWPQVSTDENNPLSQWASLRGWIHSSITQKAHFKHWGKSSVLTSGLFELCLWLWYSNATLLRSKSTCV